MEKNQPDITLHEAEEKTKKVGTTLKFDEVTVVADIYELQQRIREQNSSITTIKWIFSAIVIGAVFATVTFLFDYLQFATKAYEQFDSTIKEQNIDHKTIESMSADIKLIKHKLKIP